ncbi:MAG TPA: translation initiation factor IF-2 subunit alpha [Candidatus Bathyarchaeia archaeon]|nr:translation initiation factor IF-2 subunit alpha [Candidatus Bathyarchaeia archaeon]
MAVKKAEWPEAGDLVLASVQRITDYGAYVTLDEYGKEGLLHVSEVSSGWVRNIRDFVREGQKVVLKVLRVDTGKGHVDLSLRRVSRHERREKVLSSKMDRKAESILRSVAEKLQMPFEELSAKTIAVIEEKFGGVYEGLERAAREGADPLLEVGLPKEVAAALAEVAKEKIRAPMVKVKGILELQCMKPNGIVHIKEALESAQKAEKPRDARVRVYAIAAPKYAIEVWAVDYKEAEKALSTAAETAVETLTKAGGSGAFQKGK